MTLLGQNVNSYGHDLPPDPRFGHVDGDALGGPPARPRRAAGPRRAHPRDRRRCGPPTDARRSGACASSRRTRGTCRTGSSRRWPTARRSASTSTCRSSRARTRCCAGWAASTRSSTTWSGSPGSATPSPGIAISTDVIVGFCGETEAQFEATLRLLETVRYDQVFAAAYSPRPGTPATRLADDVPADDKRRRLNDAARASRRRSGSSATGRGSVARSRSSSTRSIRPARTSTTTTSGRGPGHDGRAAGCPAGPAATSSSTSPAPEALVGRTVARPDRACRAVRAARRARRRVTDRAAAHRHRRGDGDRQDRARDRASPRRCAPSGRPVGDHLGRLAPGLPRPRHRHGQGDGRGARARPAPRPRPRRSRRSRSASRTSSTHADGVLRDLARARAASRSSPAGRGCTCAPSLAASTRTRCRAIPSCGPDSRRSWRPAASRRSSNGCVRWRPGWRPTSTCATRGGSSGRSRSPSSSATRRDLPARGYPGPLAWLGLRVDPVEPPNADRGPGPCPVRRRPGRRGASAPRAVRSGASGVLRRSAIARPGRSSTATLTRDAAIDLDARRNVAFAKRQRDVVPGRTRHRVARRDGRPPGRSREGDGHPLHRRLTAPPRWVPDTTRPTRRVPGRPRALGV